MSWIDDFFGSSFFVYLLLFILGLSIYLKKTNQTLPDLIGRLREAIRSLEDKTEEQIKK